MKRPLVAASLATLLLSVAGPAGAQKPTFVPNRPTRAARTNAFRSSLSFTLLSSTFDNPILRQPGPMGANQGEVLTGQSVTTTGGRIGWLGATPRFGIELGVSYHKVRLSDFRYSDQQMGLDTVSFSNASVALIQGDIILLGAPFRAVPVFLYGVLGMGVQQRTYDVSGSSYTGADGHRDFGEFSYSAGLGVRLSPIRQVSLVAQYLWVPGDQTTTIPMGGCYIYVSAHGPAGVSASIAGQQGAAGTSMCKSHSNKAHLASVGVAIAVP